jgi:hypothetical protein
VTRISREYTQEPGQPERAPLGLPMAQGPLDGYPCWNRTLRSQPWRKHPKPARKGSCFSCSSRCSRCSRAAVAVVQSLQSIEDLFGFAQSQSLEDDTEQQKARLPHRSETAQRGRSRGRASRTPTRHVERRIERQHATARRGSRHARRATAPTSDAERLYHDRKVEGVDRGSGGSV